MDFETEKQYKSVTTRLGATMLIFWGLTNLLSSIGMFIIPLWDLFLVEVAADIATSLTNGAVYALSFMLPVFFFHLISRQSQVEPMKLTPKLPKETFAYIIAGMAIILGAAYLNALMLSFTNYAEFAEEMLWQDTYETPHEIVMTFITMAVIPGFVEEFLFRGLVQSNLRPYGRGVAIIGSAVLFGIMHQNIQQIFYATMAGLVLGYIYEATDSIWCCILLHLFNNGFSVLSSALAAKLPMETAERILTLAEGAIFGIGLICLIWLICRRRGKVDLSQGCFGRCLPASPDYAEYELSAQRKIKLFFSPTMIAFFALSIGVMAMYFALSLIMPYVLG